jgi:hypothetical protein
VLPAAGAATVLVIAVLAWKFWPHPTEAVVEHAPTVVPSAPIAGEGAPLAASFPDAGGVPALAPEDVETALTQADTYLKSGTADGAGGRNLIYPDDDSAWYLYRRVLATQADNARAKAGIAAIVAYYRKNAHLLCEHGQWGNCGVIARQGLKVDPTDVTLIKLDAASALGSAGQTPALPPLPAN